MVCRHDICEKLHALILVLWLRRFLLAEHIALAIPSAENMQTRFLCIPAQLPEITTDQSGEVSSVFTPTVCVMTRAI